MQMPTRVLTLLIRRRRRHRPPFRPSCLSLLTLRVSFLLFPERTSHQQFLFPIRAFKDLKRDSCIITQHNLFISFLLLSGYSFEIWNPLRPVRSLQLWPLRHYVVAGFITQMAKRGREDSKILLLFGTGDVKSL